MEEESKENLFIRFIKAFGRIILTNLLVILLITHVVSGVVIGILLRDCNFSPNTIEYIGFLGDILIQSLKSVALPVMVGAIVSNIGILDFRISGKITSRLMLFLLVHKSIATVIALTLSFTINPGITDEDEIEPNVTVHFTSTKSTRAQDKLLDIGRNLIPENWIQMFIAVQQTHIVKEPEPGKQDFYFAYGKGVNMLGVVVVSFVIGVGLSKMGDAGKPLTDVFNAILKVTMMITYWFIWLAPIGILFLICREILKAEDFGKSAVTLGKFLGILWGSCVIQVFIVYPSVYFICTRRNPYKVLASCSEAILIAVTTASSFAALPPAMKGLTENYNVDARIVEVVVPIGVTVNKDGSFYVYITASIFESQRNNVHLGLDALIVIFILSFTTSMATASVPYEAVIMLVMIWSTLNFKNLDRDLGLFFMVEFISDRFTTPLNLIGNLYCAALLDHFNVLGKDTESI